MILICVCESTLWILSSWNIQKWLRKLTLEQISNIVIREGCKGQIMKNNVKMSYWRYVSAVEISDKWDMDWSVSWLGTQHIDLLQSDMRQTIEDHHWVLLLIRTRCMWRTSDIIKSLEVKDLGRAEDLISCAGLACRTDDAQRHNDELIVYAWSQR